MTCSTKFNVSYITIFEDEIDNQSLKLCLRKKTIEITKKSQKKAKTVETFKKMHSTESQATCQEQ